MNRIALSVLCLFLASPSFTGVINTTNGSGVITTTPGSGSISTTPSPVASSGIAFDAKSQSANPSGASSPISWSHTVGNGSNRAIILGCATAFDIGTLSATVGGAAMTKSTSTAEGTPYQTYVFYRVAPSAGANTIEVSWTSGGSDHRVLCGAVSYSGVDQSTPIEISTGSYSTNGSITATVVTTTSNDTLLSVANDNGTGSQLGTPGSGQTVQVFVSDAGTNNYCLYVSTNTTTAAGSYSDTWTAFGGPVQISFIGIKPAP